MPNEPVSLEQFAYRKQAPVDVVINVIINVAIAMKSLWGLGSIAVVPQPPPTGSFSQSLFGSLFPMAIIMTMFTTMLGVRTTVQKRIKGEVRPGLDPNVRWFKPALATAVLRSFAAFGLISLFGLITHYTAPLATVSVQMAWVIVGVLAAVLAYIESVAAVLKTRDLR
jgi:hypothetical protein